MSLFMQGKSDLTVDLLLCTYGRYLQFAKFVKSPNINFAFKGTSSHFVSVPECIYNIAQAQLDQRGLVNRHSFYEVR